MAQYLNKNLYSDLPFFFTRNEFTDDINLKKDANAIAYSLQNIVLTRIGERPFDNNFGTIIYDILFENIDNNDVRLTKYKIDIINSITKYEPRVMVSSVNFNQDTSDPRLVLVTIDYIVLHTNSKKTLVVGMERTR
jgi:phage baseplate assembly protein W